jgi:site-specific DNA-methyltransferase (adenine-specific)
MIDNTDCLEFLAKQKDASVDLILVDPPFFEIAKEDWDHQWKDENEYLAWCEKWSKECARVLKPNRCFCVFGTTKTDTFLRYKLEVLNKLDKMNYVSWCVWCYDWGGKTKKTFARKHQDIFVYAKGDEWLFNADAVRVPYKMPKNINAERPNNPLGKIPTDVWEANLHTMSKEYVSWHPTQKPLVILKRFIEAYTNEGDVVLDCFAGSGSTAIACIETKRSFVGCEKDIDYWTKAEQRITDWV